MFKKNSWIVALLLALTLTALLTGCIEALPEEEEMTYTEVELGDFNVWGGQNYQRGWAVGGMKFLGVGDKTEVSVDKGYKNEDFAKATKLVIEMEDNTHPSGNLDIIWGAANDQGNTVGKDWVQTGSIKSKKEGNILTVDLTAMKGYANYKGGNYAMRKLILQAGGEKAGLPFVKKAKLLIPDKVPFVPVTGMKLARDSFYYTNEFKLEGLFTPEDATNQIVNWSIKSWTSDDGLTTLELKPYPKGVKEPTTDENYNPNWQTQKDAYDASVTALFKKVKFKYKKLTIRPDVIQEDTELWDWSVQPPQKIIVESDKGADIPGQFHDWHEDDIIVAGTENEEKESKGTVVIVATVVNGVKEPVGEEGNDGYKAGVNFVKEFTVAIKDPPPLHIKINGTATEVFFYGAVDNSGVGPSEFTPKATDGFTFKMDGGYGNSCYYIKLDAGAGNTFTDYKGISFKYKGVKGDFNDKEIRVMALDTIPPSEEYYPGKQISETANTNFPSGGASLDAVFGSKADTADPTFTTNWNALKTNQIIYVWLIPWAKGNTTFEITEIDVHK